MNATPLRTTFRAGTEHNGTVRYRTRVNRALILPILLCGSEVWNPYRGHYFPTWDKTEVERVHLQFLKRFLGVLNISIRNNIVRAELRRYPLKLKLKQWFLSKMKETSLYNYHFSTVVDFSSKKYRGSTGHSNSSYQQRNLQ